VDSTDTRPELEDRPEPEEVDGIVDRISRLEHSTAELQHAVEPLHEAICGEDTPINLELTVRQLLELDDDHRNIAGQLINLFWEQAVGGHHPYYHAHAVARLGEDYDVNGYGEHSFDGRVFDGD
jgi:hypothetical protein